MHQADAFRINPDVAAIPMSQREAIWKAWKDEMIWPIRPREIPTWSCRNRFATPCSNMWIRGMPAMPTFSAFWVSAWKVTGWCFKNIPLKQMFITVQRFRSNLNH